MVAESEVMVLAHQALVHQVMVGLGFKARLMRHLMAVLALAGHQAQVILVVEVAGGQL